MKRRKRLVEHGEFPFDGGADLRRTPDPFAHGSGERGGREAERAEARCDNQEGHEPRRDAAALGRFDQRGERHGDDGGSKNRQQDGSADVEEGAEQQQEDTDVRGLTGRNPDIGYIVHRRRIADDQRMPHFALGADIFHKTLRRPVFAQA